MLWSLSVRKVRLWNKRHSKKAKHYYLWSSMKYKNIHTDDLCILRGFFYNLGYLWSLRVTISILFQNVLLCKDILAGKGTQRNLWDESAWNTAPAAQAPNLAGSFLHGKKIPTITTVTLSRNVLPSFKTQPGSLDSLGLRKERRKIIAIWTELLSVAKHRPSTWCHTGREHHFCLREVTVPIKQTDSFTVVKCSPKWLLQIMIMTLISKKK